MLELNCCDVDIVPLQSSVKPADSIAAITITFFHPSNQLRWREDADSNKIVTLIGASILMECHGEYSILIQIVR